MMTGTKRGARIRAEQAEPQVRGRINAAVERRDVAGIEDEIVRLDEWTRLTGDADPGWEALRGYAYAARRLLTGA